MADTRDGPDLHPMTTELTTGDEARRHVDEVARKYTGGDYPPGAIKSERVILWITPHRQTIIDQNVDTSD